MSVDQKDEGFLGRWSKRKQAVQEELPDAAEAAAGEAATEPEPETDEQALEMLRERDPELADKVSGIDIDALTYEDDFTIFMNQKVPEFLRRKALSKLWLSNPVLANIDGLNDYDEDFTDAGSLVEAVQTALSKDDADTAGHETHVERTLTENEDEPTEDEPQTADEEGPLADDISDDETPDDDQDFRSV